MEPTELWVEMFHAIKEDRWQQAAECASAISHSVKTGGEPPIITGVREFDRIAASIACLAILAWQRV